MSNYPITEKFLMMEASHELQNYDLPQFWNFIEDCCNELEIPVPLAEGEMQNINPAHYGSIHS